jgi:hypothetical protein
MANPTRRGHYSVALRTVGNKLTDQWTHLKGNGPMSDELEHGTYVAGYGWWDSAINGYRDNPAKITRAEYRTAGPSDEFKRASQSKAGEFAEWAKQQRQRTGQDFTEHADLERLIALRDSPRANDNAKFDKTITPALRMMLGRYETQKAKAAN